MKYFRRVFAMIGLLCLALALTVGTVAGEENMVKTGVKKGIQVGAPWQAAEFNADHIFLHVDLPQLIRVSYEPLYDDGLEFLYEYQGMYVYFNPYERLIPLRDALADFRSVPGRTVSAVLVSHETVPGLTYSRATGAEYYAFNTWSKAGRRHVRMLLEKTAAYLGPYVDYWIAGNEIDAPHAYNEMGDMPFDRYVKNYAAFVRMLYNAMTAYNGNAVTLIPFDQGWNYSDDAHFSSAELLARLSEIFSENDFNWGVSLHPYPYDLNSADFWYDSDKAPGIVDYWCDTPFCTMDNVKYVTEYIASTYTYNGQPRPICLTEVGFNAYTNGEYSERIQAAALAYGYLKAERDPNVDLFIYCAASDEWNPAYSFGLKTADGSRRQAFDVFYYMDTNRLDAVTADCRNYFGIDSWDELFD